MSLKKILASTLATFLCAGLLSAQSLVDLAKKEKERRAKIKGQKTIQVTNADLGKLNKKPAIIVPETSSEEESPLPPAPPVEEAAAEEDQPTPSLPAVETVELSLDDLKQTWEKAEEYVELLTLKMSALWQEFYHMDDMTPKDTIQKQISETHLKLEKAREDAEKAKKAYELALSQKKAGRIRIP